jgi:rubrerythrin
MTIPGRPDGEHEEHEDALDRGGDPACWLARVCPDCGLLAEREPPTRCLRCGAEIAVS